MKCIEDEIPFEIPESWAWERLGNISLIARGGSPRPIKSYLTNDENGINWIKIGDTEIDGKYIYSTKEKIKPEGASKSRYVKSGDFLLTNSMSFGRPYILKTDGCIHDGWLVIGNIEFVFYQDYLYYALSANFMYNALAVLAGGSTVDNLNSDLVKALLFPIPPMNEQIHIASKVENLLNLIVKINEDKEIITKDIKDVKSKILDLAIRGKLVTQDPNDEPASVLLERIRTEKEELIKQGKIKRDKKESVIFKGEDNSYYEKYGEKLPAGWVVTNFETFLEYEQPTKYIVSDTNYKSSYKIPVLTAGKSFILGYTNETDNVFNDLPVIIFDDFTTESKFVNFPFKVKSSAMKILHINTDLVFPQYAFYLMKTTEIDHENHQRYWISTYSQEEVALPPLNEQKKILAKLEYYFTLLDQIQ